MLRGMVSLGVVMLAGCGPRTITLAEGQCQNLRIGDRIEGVATLNAYYDGICMECGATLQQTGCVGEIGYRNATDAADNEYHRIIQQLPANRHYGLDDHGFVSGQVFVAGEIIPNGADGSPMLNAQVIRRVED